MNESRKSVSLSVYFLSVVCALLIGFIAGYFLPIRRPTEHKIELAEEPDVRSLPTRRGGILREKTVRDDILYFNTDMEKMWEGSFKEIPKGDTRIRGRVLLNEKPMEGLQVALLFAPGRKTEPITTNANGEYEISVPEDEYTLFAILCYNKENGLTNKICLNKIIELNGYSMLNRPFFKQSSKKEVPLLVPDIEYRDPVQIVSPASGSHEKLDRIRFSWTPYPRATSYVVEISSVTKKADATYYNPAMVSQVQNVSVDYAELLRTIQGQALLGFENRMEEKRWYTIRVKALDVNGKILSASSEMAVKEILFRVD